MNGAPQAKAGFLIALVMLTLACAVTAQAQEVRLHAAAASSYVWRGITRHDNVTLHPALEVEVNSFRTMVWSAIRSDELDEINNQGLFTEVDIEMAWRLDMYPYLLDLGYTEYMFSAGAPNTREAFANLILPVNEWLDISAMLAYDMGVFKDFYFNTGIKLHGEMARNLTGSAEAAFGAAGNGFSQGPKGGLHDFGVTLGLTHEIDRNLHWGVDLKQTGSLDKKVLPEQDVETVLNVRVTMSF